MENQGLILAKQLAFRDCYIPPGLRGKIKIDWKNLVVSSQINKGGCGIPTSVETSVT